MNAWLWGRPRVKDETVTRYEFFDKMHAVDLRLASHCHVRYLDIHYDSESIFDNLNSQIMRAHPIYLSLDSNIGGRLANYIERGLPGFCNMCLDLRLLHYSVITSVRQALQNTKLKSNQSSAA